MASSSSPLQSNLPISKQFFKVMMPGFRDKLALPLPFCRQLEGQRSDKAVLTTRKGSFQVTIRRAADGCFYFEDGWDEFVRAHDLNIADFLVFDHKRKLLFDVIMFGPNACEKEFPLLSNSEKKRASTGIQKDKDTKRRTRHSLLQQNELKVVAPYSPRNPHFTTRINATNHERAYMTIPVDFVNANGLSKLCVVGLKDGKGKVWLVEVRSRPGCTIKSKRHVMSRGWQNFYAANKIKIGDLCVFELDGKTKAGGVVLNVSIFPTTT